jgi:phytoene synthase
VAIKDLDALLSYCYQVAGTVGLMMCDVLGAKNPAASPYAVDLGIAMQLTNICRDVLDDAVVGRRYLPASMVGDLSPGELVNPSADIQPQLQACLGQLLGIADRYYRSGEMGLSYLPAGARTGILTAARIYRQIGFGLQRRRYRYWQGRVVVHPARKVVVTAKLLLEAPLSRSFWSPCRAHEPAMHSAFSAMLMPDAPVQRLYVS